MTKLYSVIILVMMMTSSAYAQTQHVDTIVLSVYNTSQRFMPFGATTPASGFTAEMVRSLDTAQVLRPRPDSAGNLVPVWYRVGLWQGFHRFTRQGRVVTTPSGV